MTEVSVEATGKAAALFSCVSDNALANRDDFQRRPRCWSAASASLPAMSADRSTRPHGAAAEEASSTMAAAAALALPSPVAVAWPRHTGPSNTSSRQGACAMERRPWRESTARAFVSASPGAVLIKGPRLLFYIIYICAQLAMVRAALIVVARLDVWKISEVGRWVSSGRRQFDQKSRRVLEQPQAGQGGLRVTRFGLIERRCGRRSKIVVRASMCLESRNNCALTRRSETST